MGPRCGSGHPEALCPRRSRPGPLADHPGLRESAVGQAARGV